MTSVVFLLVPGLHLLDLAGPAQAFSTAADLGCGYELHYVAEQEDVRTAQGATVRAAHGLAATDHGRPHHRARLALPRHRGHRRRCPPPRSNGSRATTPTAAPS